MNKKKIISNTIMFLSIMLFINVFQRLFGNENTLVGVTVITAALVLLERDLTISPFRNLIKLLGINMLTTFAAYYANSNMWLGIILNFTILFTIGYLFSYNLRKSIFVPFGLQYLFILFNPVYGESFLKRILALIFGAFFVMSLQFLANMNKISKTGSKIVDTICENILLKINLLEKNKDVTGVNIDIVQFINSLKKIVYDKRVGDFYITKAGKITTNILFSLERINILLDKLKEDDYEKESYVQFLGTIYEKVASIKEKLFNISDIEAIYLNTDLNRIYIHEIINSVQILYIEMSKMKMLDKKNKNSIENNHKIPIHFNKVSTHKKNFEFNSLRVSYGIRLGIAGCFTAFITAYFHLSEGRWMVYTIFSLIQPYAEISNMKSKQRIEGTLIGALIVFFCFSLITNTTIRFLIVLLAGYLNPFTVNYKALIACVTVSAVASSAMVGGTTKFVLSRIVFVAIGAAVAALINKFVLPYKFEDGKKELVSTYNNLVNQMLSDIKDNNDNIEDIVKNLFLIPALIEDRMNVIDFGKNCSKEKDFIYTQRVLVNNLYNYYLLLNKDKCIRKNIFTNDKII
ncbi:FUSC family protein [Clostridium tagluense]|uniref:FUSC family protein n=1 Tax=Clostridium tagluense TaxID=360422 RepID=A0A401UG98_9CLOT|nr:FUSC family protein [Clostridium tagluense]GCD08587.1 FUSC family protein [Clostridium tagluense]